MENKGLMLLLLGGAAYYFLRGTKGGPQFYNMSGVPITEIKCGNSVTFDVRGYTRVWMERLKDGVLDFTQPFDLPMAPYIMNCQTDIGVYDVAVYEIDAAGQKAGLIGQTKFTVIAQA